MDAEQGAPPAGKWRTLIACNIGVCLEGFDFIAYSAFAPILAKLYFPNESALVSALLTFAGFATAYVVRPFGGLFWGIYADKRGRRTALAAVSVLMAVGTAILSLTPPYAAIGVAAPILILVARAIQGFAVSGEFASATAMLVELAPKGRKSFFASTQMASQVLTAGLAAAVVLILSATLSPADLEAWGWRVALGAGTVIGPVGLYIRMRLSESPEFTAIARSNRISKTPLRNAVRLYPGALACMAGLIVISSAALYLIVVFLPLFASTQLGIPPRSAQISLMIATVGQAAVILAAGRLSDRIGTTELLLPACIAYALLAYPLFAWLARAPSFSTLLTVQLASGALLGLISGPLPSALSAMLPTEVRSTALGLVYNLVGSIFGGLGPLIIVTLIAVTGDKAAPAFWASATGAVGIAAALAMWRARPARIPAFRLKGPS